MRQPSRQWTVGIWTAGMQCPWTMKRHGWMRGAPSDEEATAGMIHQSSPGRIIWPTVIREETEGCTTITWEIA